MKVFNSLGSNFNFRSANSHAWGQGKAADLNLLQAKLAHVYGGQAQLYYQGRAALSWAVKLTGAKHVIINGFTCQAVEQAILAAGANPVFADLAPESYHFDLERLRQAHQKQPEAGAVIVQNTFGYMVDIGPIANYCQANNLYLIEDLAHSLGLRYPDGRRAGSVGDLTMLSFGRDKHLDVVTGGALIVRNLKLQDRAPKMETVPITQRLHNRFYPLLTWWVRLNYAWPLLGRLWHFGLKKIGFLRPAAGRLYLAPLPPYLARRILKGFSQLSADHLRRLKILNIYNPDQAHLPLVRYPILAKNKQLLVQALTKAGFYLGDHWYDYPIYPARLAKTSTYKAGDCPQAETIANQVINLPLSCHLTLAQAKKIKAILDDCNRFEVKDVDQTAWQAAQVALPESNLMTAWETGQAYEGRGSRIVRQVIYEQDQPRAAFLGVIREARRGRYLEIAGGPLSAMTPFLSSLLQAALTRAAKKHKCVFIRCQPFVGDQSEVQKEFLQNGWRKAPAPINAPYTRLLDLSLSEEQILAQMRRQTRYNVKKGLRNEIKIKVDNSLKSFESFLDLLKETVKRQKFTPTNWREIKAQYEAWSQTENLKIYLGYDGDQLLSGALMLTVGNQMIYYYGASLPTKRHVNYVLQYQAILDAKAAGLAFYNFWGVAPPEAKPEHPLTRVTTFKAGFGGQLSFRGPTWDLVLRPSRYPLNWLIEKVRQKHRKAD